MDLAVRNGDLAIILGDCTLVNVILLYYTVGPIWP